MAVDVSGLVSQCTAAAVLPAAAGVLCDLAEDYAEQCRRKSLAHQELHISELDPGLTDSGLGFASKRCNQKYFEKCTIIGRTFYSSSILFLQTVFNAS
jgi:hypothetical protein